MPLDQARPVSDSFEAQGRVRNLVQSASNLALFGAEPLSRELCASIFLNHAPQLLADPEAKQGFVACLLLLNMNQLLSRTLRALDGVDVSCTTVCADGAERKILSFSNGSSLAIPLPDAGTDRVTRERFAASWSCRIIEAATFPAEGWVADPSGAPPATMAASAPLTPERAPAPVA